MTQANYLQQHPSGCMSVQPTAARNTLHKQTTCSGTHYTAQANHLHLRTYMTLSML